MTTFESSNEGRNDFEVVEVENYASANKGEQFNYPILIFASMRKCFETGAKEMKEGYYNIKFDARGNMSSRFWIPDSREEFIESVETLNMIMSRDFDKEAKEIIKEIREKIKQLFETYCKYEKERWDNLSGEQQQKFEKENGGSFIEGKLTANSFYYNRFLNDKVKLMRLIFQSLSELAKRLDDYREEMITA